MNVPAGAKIPLVIVGAGEDTGTRVESQLQALIAARPARGRHLWQRRAVGLGADRHRRSDLRAAAGRRHRPRCRARAAAARRSPRKRARSTRSTRSSATSSSSPRRRPEVIEEQRERRAEAVDRRRAAEGGPGAAELKMGEADGEDGGRLPRARTGSRVVRLRRQGRRRGCSPTERGAGANCAGKGFLARRRFGAVARFQRLARRRDRRRNAEMLCGDHAPARAAPSSTTRRWCILRCRATAPIADDEVERQLMSALDREGQGDHRRHELNIPSSSASTQWQRATTRRCRPPTSSRGWACARPTASSR